MKKVFLSSSKNYFQIYYADNELRPCVLICPGGGYNHTSPRESEPVAKVFNSFGMHAVVLNYREELNSFPNPILNVSETIKYLRNDSLIISDKIVGLGFSAGGHAILSNAIYGEEKPNYLVLCYPVITADPKYCHQGSVDNLLSGMEQTPELLDKISLEKHIDSNIPDTFLWHTFTDESVPVENSLLLVDAYRKCQADLEFHLMPYGGHGLSLATLETCGGDPKKVIPYVSRWVNMVNDWLKLKNIIE